MLRKCCVLLKFGSEEGLWFTKYLFCKIDLFLEKLHLRISFLKELIVPARTEISCLLQVCI